MSAKFQPITKILLKIISVITFPFRVVFNRILSIKGFEKIKAALQTPDIQKRIIFTIFMVLSFRVLASIPLPGVDIEVYRAAINSNTGSAFSNLWTIATGGNIDAPSLVVIGLGSYINASIIVQLLTTVIPKLEELQKEGENGRRIISQITRYLTLPLSLIQGFVIYTVIKNNLIAIPDSGYTVSELVSNLNPQEVAIMVLAVAAGSILLMWFSELITERGIGNGSSIIIMVGILSTLPGILVTDFKTTFDFFWSQIKEGQFEAIFSNSMLFTYAVILGLIALLVTIVFINEATRKVQIQYARRVRGSNVGQSSYLPFKINQAGVMPIIFASSILTFPTIIAQFAASSSVPGEKLYDYSQRVLTWDIFNFQSYQYLVFYFLLIVIFTFFYTFIVNKPEETADNLQKSGAFIPGIRPGKSTASHITHILIRLTTVGALFLGVLAVIPSLVRLTEQGANLLVFTGIGGTSLLIIVGVILDTIRQMKSLTISRSYEMYK